MNSTDSPRVKGSIPVRGNFFAEFIFLQYNSGCAARKIYFRETSIPDSSCLFTFDQGKQLKEITLRLAEITAQRRYKFQWQIQDFPDGGQQTVISDGSKISRGGIQSEGWGLTYYVAKICRKLHEE